MKAVNAVNLEIGLSNLTPEDQIVFESQLSEREAPLKRIKADEVSALGNLVRTIAEADSEYLEHLDGFAYSFQIPQMDVEMDLLKITATDVINIELKSEPVSEDKLLKQLARHQYFLSPLNRSQHLFEYVAREDAWHAYREGRLERTGRDEVIELLNNAGRSIEGHYENLFKVSDYLVSPINNPDRFLAKQYLLSPQQREAAEYAERKAADQQFFAMTIRGSAGTGKSLLLYDIARRLGTVKPACIVHCGHLSEGHHSLNRKQNLFRIIPAKSLSDTDFGNHSALLFDEVHRIYPCQLKSAVSEARANSMPALFALDARQVLSNKEMSWNIESLLHELIPKAEGKKIELSKRYRSNKELAGFIKGIFGPTRPSEDERFRNVKVLYASTPEEAKAQVGTYQNKGYQYISTTNSTYTSSDLDSLTWIGCMNTHDVIGQEFDKVVLTVGPFLTVDERGFVVRETHPNPNYLTDKLFLQGLTRARTNLAIVVYKNYPLFKALLKLIA